MPPVGFEPEVRGAVLGCRRGRSRRAALRAVPLRAPSAGSGSSAVRRTGLESGAAGGVGRAIPTGAEGRRPSLTWRHARVSAPARRIVTFGRDPHSGAREGSLWTRVEPARPTRRRAPLPVEAGTARLWRDILWDVISPSC